MLNLFKGKEMTREEAVDKIPAYLYTPDLKAIIDKVYDNFEDRCCNNCITDYKTCSIFFGANNQICLLSNNFNCSLWSQK